MVIKYTKSVLNHVLPHNLTACKLKPPMYLFTVESFFFFFQFRFSAESYPACFSFGVGEEGSLHQLCAWDSMYYGGNLVQINSNNLGPIKETIWKSFKAEPAIQNTISLSTCLPSTMSLPGILNYGGGPKVTVYACVH